MRSHSAGKLYESGLRDIQRDEDLQEYEEFSKFLEVPADKGSLPCSDMCEGDISSNNSKSVTEDDQDFISLTDFKLYEELNKEYSNCTEENCWKTAPYLCLSSKDDQLLHSKGRDKYSLDLNKNNSNKLKKKTVIREERKKNCYSKLLHAKIPKGNKKIVDMPADKAMGPFIVDTTTTEKFINDDISNTLKLFQPTSGTIYLSNSNGVSKAIIIDPQQHSTSEIEISNLMASSQPTELLDINENPLEEQVKQVSENLEKRQVESQIPVISSDSSIKDVNGEEIVLNAGSMLHEPNNVQDSSIKPNFDDTIITSDDESAEITNHDQLEKSQKNFNLEPTDQPRLTNSDTASDLSTKPLVQENLKPAEDHICSILKDSSNDSIILLDDTPDNSFTTEQHFSATNEAFPTTDETFENETINKDVVGTQVQPELCYEEIEVTIFEENDLDFLKIAEQSRDETEIDSNLKPNLDNVIEDMELCENSNLCGDYEVYEIKRVATASCKTTDYQQNRPEKAAAETTIEEINHNDLPVPKVAATQQYNEQTTTLSCKTTDDRPKQPEKAAAETTIEEINHNDLPVPKVAATQQYNEQTTTLSCKTTDDRQEQPEKAAAETTIEEINHNDLPVLKVAATQQYNEHTTALSYKTTDDRQKQPEKAAAETTIEEINHNDLPVPKVAATQQYNEQTTTLSCKTTDDRQEQPEKAAAETTIEEINHNDLPVLKVAATQQYNEQTTTLSCKTTDDRQEQPEKAAAETTIEEINHNDLPVLKVVATQQYNEHTTALSYKTTDDRQKQPEKAAAETTIEEINHNDLPVPKVAATQQYNEQTTALSYKTTDDRQKQPEKAAAETTIEEINHNHLPVPKVAATQQYNEQQLSYKTTDDRQKQPEKAAAETTIEEINHNHLPVSNVADTQQYLEEIAIFSCKTTDDRQKQLEKATAETKIKEKTQNNIPVSKQKQPEKAAAESTIKVKTQNNIPVPKQKQPEKAATESTIKEKTQNNIPVPKQKQPEKAAAESTIKEKTQNNIPVPKQKQPEKTATGSTSKEKTQNNIPVSKQKQPEKTATGSTIKEKNQNNIPVPKQKQPEKAATGSTIKEKTLNNIPVPKDAEARPNLVRNQPPKAGVDTAVRSTAKDSVKKVIIYQKDAKESVRKNTKDDVSTVDSKQQSGVAKTRTAKKYPEMYAANKTASVRNTNATYTRTENRSNNRRERHRVRKRHAVDNVQNPPSSKRPKYEEFPTFNYNNLPTLAAYVQPCLQNQQPVTLGSTWLPAQHSVNYPTSKRRGGPLNEYPPKKFKYQSDGSELADNRDPRWSMLNFPDPHNSFKAVENQWISTNLKLHQNLGTHKSQSLLLGNTYDNSFKCTSVYEHILQNSVGNMSALANDLNKNLHDKPLREVNFISNKIAELRSKRKKLCDAIYETKKFHSPLTRDVYTVSTYRKNEAVRVNEIIDTYDAFYGNK